jgi:hypothetical protein
MGSELLFEKGSQGFLVIGSRPSKLIVDTEALGRKSTNATVPNCERMSR